MSMHGDKSPSHDVEASNNHANQSSTNMAEAHSNNPGLSTPSRCQNSLQQPDSGATTWKTPPPPVRNIQFCEVGSPKMVQRLEITTEMEEKFELGYDSDQEIGPFLDAIEEEGDQIFDEEGVPDESEDAIIEDPCQTSECPEEEKQHATTMPPPLVNIDIFIPIEDGMISKMKVSELRDELNIRELSTRGKKHELLDRLRKALADKVHVRKSKPQHNCQKKATAKEKQSDVGKDFPPTARWEVLTPDKEQAPEPSNPTFHQPRAPTVGAGDAAHVPLKYNFSKYKFDIPQFTGTREQQKKLRGGRRSKEKVKVPIRKGFTKPSAIKKFKLTPYSLPHEYVNVFLPFAKNIQSVAGENGCKKKEEMLSIDLITRWTNTKATMMGAGDSIYPDWKPFTREEIRRHLGLYIFNGTAPVPQIDLRFNSQAKDPIHGNDMISNAFGTNASNRHRQFKCFFALQNPCIPTPPRKKYPNWKVRPLLKWINCVGPQVYKPGKSISVDEMTIGFQGRHADKKRITYKAEGDGFQADALCDDGYTVQMHMRNDPAPKQYLKNGTCPLHARVLSLFDVLEEEYHQAGMDNLYNSVTFSKKSFKHKKKVLVHGVARKGGRGIPKCVIQNEVQKRVEQLRVRGTVKAAVLKGDEDCPNLIAASVYDTKPVHYLSMVSENIRWVEKATKVYNVDTEDVEEMKFLRMGFIDNYNNTMGDVDLADQLRGNYRFDMWVRNRKWWWSIMFWGFGLLVTNAYVCYCKVCDEKNIPKKNRRSHLEFQKDLAMAWIDQEFFERYLETNKSPMKRKMAEAAYCSPITVDIQSAATTSRSSKRKVNEVTVAAKRIRCTAVTDTTLDPNNGSLRCRLSRTGIDHLPHEPMTKKGTTRCQLHRWLDIEYCKNVAYCQSCNVHLCTCCYQLFHNEVDIVHQKQELKQRLKP